MLGGQTLTNSLPGSDRIEPPQGIFLDSDIARMQRIARVIQKWPGL